VVLVGDHIYGDSDSSGVPFCAELMTGKITWKKRGSGKGSAAGPAKPLPALPPGQVGQPGDRQIQAVTTACLTQTRHLRCC